MRCRHERGTGLVGRFTSHPSRPSQYTGRGPRSQVREGWGTRNGVGMSETKRVGEARPSLVVMKFGGTSVEDAKAMLRTAAIVRGRRERGLKPVVVVSAMAKVTDQLLAAAAAAGRGDKNGALAIASRLRNRHLDTAAELLCGDLFTEIRAAICKRFDALDDLLRGIAAVGELTPRTTDKVID